MSKSKGNQNTPKKVPPQQPVLQRATPKTPANRTQQRRLDPYAALLLNPFRVDADIRCPGDYPRSTATYTHRYTYNLLGNGTSGNNVLVVINWACLLNEQVNATGCQIYDTFISCASYDPTTTFLPGATKIRNPVRLFQTASLPASVSSTQDLDPYDNTIYPYEGGFDGNISAGSTYDSTTYSCVLQSPGNGDGGSYTGCLNAQRLLDGNGLSTLYKSHAATDVRMVSAGVRVKSVGALLNRQGTFSCADTSLGISAQDKPEDFGLNKASFVSYPGYSGLHDAVQETAVARWMPRDPQDRTFFDLHANTTDFSQMVRPSGLSIMYFEGLQAKFNLEFQVFTHLEYVPDFAIKGLVKTKHGRVLSDQIQRDVSYASTVAESGWLNTMQNVARTVGQVASATYEGFMSRDEQRKEMFRNPLHALMG